ncbi:MAG: DUF1905 domain-containing protein [Herbiconiux sp.]|nr:DUF1905 domain-containing protein [Herbiconiux sp.]
MQISVAGELWYWRGPSPFHFVTVPAAESELIAELAPAVSYGWGMVPAEVQVGSTRLPTALWPKDGGYIVPLKAALRARENLQLGDRVELVLHIAP